MEWIKASVSTCTEGVEPVLGVLLSCGINGAQIVDPSELRKFLKEEPLQWDYVDEALLNDTGTDASVEFYVTPNADGHEMLAMVRSQLTALAGMDIGIPLGSLQLTVESLDDKTWLDEWKKYYKPFHISKSVVVVPVWERYTAEPGELVFTIDPGSVFGTGLHQTTQLCVELIEEYVKPGDSLLDIGCGSGILSIIGMLLGAKDVFACDIDPAAAVASRDNVSRNPVNPDNYTVLTGNIFTDGDILNAVSSRLFDMVLVNIVADVVIKLTPIVKGYLKPEGLLIISGIIDERVGDVQNALKENGFKLLEVKSRDGWFCMAATNA